MLDLVTRAGDAGSGWEGRGGLGNSVCELGGTNVGQVADWACHASKRVRSWLMAWSWASLVIDGAWWSALVRV